MDCSALVRLVLRAKFVVNVWLSPGCFTVVRFIMAELLQTERTFVKDLENCINVSSLVRDQEWLIVYSQTE